MKAKIVFYYNKAKFILYLKDNKKNFIFLQIVLVRNKRNCIFAPLLAEDFAIKVKQRSLNRFKTYSLCRKELISHQKEKEETNTVSWKEWHLLMVEKY